MLLMCCAVSCNAADLELNWQALPEFPVQGVAGPLVGFSGDTLIVAGGANFSFSQGEDAWSETATKVWHDDAYILSLSGSVVSEWRGGFQLQSPIAYSAVVSTPHGMICMGGEDSQAVSKKCFILCMDGDQLVQKPLPDLPQPCSYGAAAVIGDQVYLAGGLNGQGQILHNFWRLDLSQLVSGGSEFRWEELPAWPGPERMLNLTLAQHNGTETCIYVVSGRSGRALEGGAPGDDVLRDVYEFSPQIRRWRCRSDIPQGMYAGAGAAVGALQILILSGVDSKTASLPMSLRDQHPGFSLRTWAYNTVSDTWTDAGSSPENQIVTPAVTREDEIFLVAGEIKPRIRSRSAWRITVKKNLAESSDQ